MAVIGIVFCISGVCMWISGWQSMKKIDRKSFRYDIEYDQERTRVIEEALAASSWMFGIGGLLLVLGTP